MPNLSTKTARRNLPRSSSKRWVRIAKGKSLGYRRSGSGPGSWYVRVHIGKQRYRMASLGTADDLSEGDGNSVLTFGQAFKLALEWEPGSKVDHLGPLTVAKAVGLYLRWSRVENKSYEQQRYVSDANVLPELGEILVEELTVARIRNWHIELAESPARLRGGQLRVAITQDQKRARKVTANRALTLLKAALNHVADDKPEDFPRPWKKVKAFKLRK